MKKISLVINFAKKNALSVAERVILVLKSSVQLVVDSETAEKLGNDCVCVCDDIYKADMLIAIGGDGTILHNAKKAARNNCPVLGINAGRIGYLASLEPQDIDKLPEIVSGNYTVEDRMMLRVIHKTANGVSEYKAFNDIVISKGALSRMVDIKLSVDEHLLRYRADGLIIATPTGSTAYSLSAGGPVIDPRVNDILVTPICSYEYFTKPIILPADVKLSVTAEVDSVKRLFLTVDGENAVEISADDTVKIESDDVKVKLVKYRSESILDRLERKIQQS